MGLCWCGLKGWCAGDNKMENLTSFTGAHVAMQSVLAVQVGHDQVGATGHIEHLEDMDVQRGHVFEATAQDPLAHEAMHDLKIKYGWVGGWDVNTWMGGRVGSDGQDDCFVLATACAGVVMPDCDPIGWVGGWMWVHTQLYLF
jgi:hypothetical protein